MTLYTCMVYVKNKNIRCGFNKKRYTLCFSCEEAIVYEFSKLFFFHCLSIWNTKVYVKITLINAYQIKTNLVKISHSVFEIKILNCKETLWTDCKLFNFSPCRESITMGRIGSSERDNLLVNVTEHMIFPRRWPPAGLSVVRAAQYL